MISAAAIVEVCGVSRRTARRWLAAGWRPGVPTPRKGPPRRAGGRGDFLDARLRRRLEVLRALVELCAGTTSDVARAAGLPVMTTRSYLRGLRDAGEIQSTTIHGVTVWEAIMVDEVKRPILYFVLDLLRQRVPDSIIVREIGLSEEEVDALIRRARHLWPELPAPIEDPEARAERLAAKRAEAARRRSEASQVATRVEVALRLTPGSRAVLEALTAAIMPLSAATLVRRTNFSAATVRASLHQLVAAGLVEPAAKRTQGQTYRPIPGASHA